MVELTVVLVVGLLVMTALIDVLGQQARFYRNLRERSDNKTQLRQIVQFVPSLFRAVSPRDTMSGSVTGGDIYSWSDRSLEFRGTFGTSVLCSIDTAQRTIRLPPADTVGSPVKNRLTAWLTQPAAGDSLVIYDADVNDAKARWRAYAISSITEVKGAAGCPAGTGYLLAADDSAKSSFKIVLASPVAVGSTGVVTTLAGAPVRFFRRMHLELATGKDGSWYLEYFDCSPSYGTGSGCSALTPIAGPLMPYSGTDSQTGFRFAYYDSTGAALAPATSSPRQLARLDITARTREATSVGSSGKYIAPFVDSIRFTIGLRNRH